MAVHEYISPSQVGLDELVAGVQVGAEALSLCVVDGQVEVVGDHFFGMCEHESPSGGHNRQDVMTCLGVGILLRVLELLAASKLEMKMAPRPPTPSKTSTISCC